MNRINLLIVALIVISSSCKSDKIPEGFNDDDHYFSVSQFLDDQWKNKGGNPYLLTKVVKKDNTIDSSYVSWNDSFFNEIRKPFDKADISDQKYLGKYHFTETTDNTTGWLVAIFEANDEDLYTQKLIISINKLNNRIISIYIETLNDGFLKEETEKLTYIPNKSIQFVDFEKTLLAKPKKVITTYTF